MWKRWLTAAVLLPIPQFLSADTIFINFENFVDGDVVTNQIPGLSFTDTVVLTAGFSLNEIDFPPHSGVNVVSDNGGSISIHFSTPVLGFSAYFTYVEPLSLSAFDSSNAQLGSAVSLFSNNTVSGGDPGSLPNELLQVSSLSGISSVSIAGDPAGGSFVMDDVTLTTAPSAVPEPSSLYLASGMGLAAVFFQWRLRSRSQFLRGVCALSENVR